MNRSPSFAGPALATLLAAAPAHLCAQQFARSVEQTLPRAKAQAMADRIDRALADALRLHNTAPTPPIDDATFLRRAYLSIVGRIPSRDEAEAFLTAATHSTTTAPADRRADLIDRLLDSPGHASHEANFWFDLLRVKSRLRQMSGEPFAHYIRQSILDDVPYDEFVRRMLVAEGPAHAENNGATGFLLRDANMPHDAMANTLRLFVGTRLECAQCHNHPFDKWTQQEFYGMAAFFGGLRYRTNDSRLLDPEVRRALQQADDRTRALARRTIQNATTGLAGSGTGLERLPADYKYDDAAPRSPVRAATIFGEDVQLAQPQRTEPARGPAQRGQQRRPRNAGRAGAAEVDSREALADWMTSPDNPRFAKVAVNRIWQRLFGRGLIDPVDDLKDDTAAVHPKVQIVLEQILVDLRFDLRQFQRVLLLTDLFQRAAVEDDPDPSRPFLFEGPLLRRMTAEQTWDSLLTLVDADLDARIQPPDARAREVYEQFSSAAQTTTQELVAMLQDPQRLLQEERRRRLAAQRPRGQRGRDADLLRASDLVQPAPPGHLLRQFGQSDRETMDAATDDANVPQVLTLMNGFLDQRVLGGASSLRRALQTARTPTEQVRAAFVAVLSRAPSAAELATWQRAIADEGDTALRDLVWVLCNTNEFRFVP